MYRKCIQTIIIMSDGMEIGHVGEIQNPRACRFISKMVMLCSLRTSTHRNAPAVERGWWMEVQPGMCHTPQDDIPCRSSHV